MNHLKNGFFHELVRQQKGEGFEFHILVVGISLSLMISGGGIFSFDRGLTREKTENM